MRYRLFICVLLMGPFVVLAQNTNTATVRAMTAMDSIMVKQLFLSGMTQKTISNYSEAAALFNRVLQSDPKNDAAMYQLASIKIIKNDYTNAQALLEHAVTINPDNEWYWLSLTDCYEKTNNISKLENALDALIRLTPDKFEYYFEEANAYYLEKRYDDALKIYARLTALMGMNDDILAGRQKIYLVQGKIDEAADDIQAMIANNPTQIKYYLLLAELYNSNKLNDKALKVLEKAVKVNPGDGRLHLALADVYRDKKNYQACFDELKLAFAIPSLDIALKIKIILGYLPKFPDPDARASALALSSVLVGAHPADSRAYAIYGDMLFQNEKYADAEDAYRTSIKFNNQRYEVYEQLVRIELSENKIDKAISDAEDALSYFPNQGWMNYLAGVAYAQKKNYDKAVKYINNAISLAIDDKDLLAAGYSSLGDCYHELKDEKASDDAYDKSLTYNPDNAFVLNNYAYYLSVRGEQLDKAAQMSAHSNELQPNTASFEDTYAWILFKQKKYADAKVWIEKAILHDKTNSAVQTEHYGDIMFYLGNTDAAVANWKKAKQFGEQSPVLERKINERKYVE